MIYNSEDQCFLENEHEYRSVIVPGKRPLESSNNIAKRARIDDSDNESDNESENGSEYSIDRYEYRQMLIDEYSVNGIIAELTQDFNIQPNTNDFISLVDQLVYARYGSEYGGSEYDGSEYDGSEYDGSEHDSDNDSDNGSEYMTRDEYRQMLIDTYPAHGLIVEIMQDFNQEPVSNDFMDLVEQLVDLKFPSSDDSDSDDSDSEDEDTFEDTKMLKEWIDKYMKDYMFVNPYGNVFDSDHKLKREPVTGVKVISHKKTTTSSPKKTSPPKTKKIVAIQPKYEKGHPLAGLTDEQLDELDEENARLDELLRQEEEEKWIRIQQLFPGSSTASNPGSSTQHAVIPPRKTVKPQPLKKKK